VMLYQLSYFPIPWKRRIVYQKSERSCKGEICNDDIGERLTVKSLLTARQDEARLG